jgi:hypothetical protein
MEDVSNIYNKKENKLAQIRYENVHTSTMQTRAETFDVQYPGERRNENKTCHTNNNQSSRDSMIFVWVFVYKKHKVLLQICLSGLFTIFAFIRVMI